MLAPVDIECKVPSACTVIALETDMLLEGLDLLVGDWHILTSLTPAPCSTTTMCIYIYTHV